MHRKGARFWSAIIGKLYVRTFKFLEEIARSNKDGGIKIRRTRTIGSGPLMAAEGQSGSRLNYLMNSTTK